MKKSYIHPLIQVLHITRHNCICASPFTVEGAADPYEQGRAKDGGDDFTDDTQW